MYVNPDSNVSNPVRVDLNLAVALDHDTIRACAVGSCTDEQNKTRFCVTPARNENTILKNRCKQDTGEVQAGACAWIPLRTAGSVSKIIIKIEGISVAFYL